MFFYSVQKRGIIMKRVMLIGKNSESENIFKPNFLSNKCRFLSEIGVFY